MMSREHRQPTPDDWELHRPARNTTSLQLLQNSLTADNAQLFIIVVSAALAFLPLLQTSSAVSALEDTQLRASVESRAFRESSVGILTVALAFLVDFLVDHSTHVLSRHAYRRYTKFSHMVVDIEVALFIVGIVVVPLVGLLSESRPLALIYTCASCTQSTLLGGFVARMCCRLYRPHFPMWVMLPSTAIFSISAVYIPIVLNASPYMVSALGYLPFCCLAAILFNLFFVTQRRPATRSWSNGRTSRTGSARCCSWRAWPAGLPSTSPHTRGRA